MEKNKKRIKKYFYHRSNLWVISITDNMDKWKAIPSKKLLNHTTVKVDITKPNIPEGDSPNIIAYKKKKGLILVED